MVQVGYSAGARSRPSFAWVRNILSRCTSPSTIDTLDRKSSHVYSLFWMLIQKKLPNVISDDIITWLAQTNIPRMNKNGLLELGEECNIGEIELDIAGNLFSFHQAEYAPPSGVMAANYSRHILLLSFCSTY